MINIRKCDDKFAAVAPVNCQPKQLPHFRQRLKKISEMIDQPVSKLLKELSKNNHIVKCLQAPKTSKNYLPILVMGQGSSPEYTNQTNGHGIILTKFSKELANHYIYQSRRHQYTNQEDASLNAIQKNASIPV